MKKNKKIIKILTLVLPLLSLCLIYIGGFFSSSTKFEQLAEYGAKIVKENTINKKYAAITVQATKDSGGLPDSDTEFHQLYGVFRQQKITFASTMNANKDHDIRLGDNLTENLSVFYAGPVGTKTVDGKTRHYTYPFYFMFDDKKYFDINKYVIYISKSHADKLLDTLAGHTRNEYGEFEESDYRALIKSEIKITIDGQTNDVLIQNIFFETGYFFDGLKDIMGDFVISSYYFHGNLRSEQENIYFLSEYTYQNSYFMKYINELYNSRKFNIRLNHFNIVGEIDDDYFLSFYYSSQLNELNWVSICLFVIAAILLVISFVAFVFASCRYNFLSGFWKFMHIVCLFIPYIAFKSLYLMTSNIVFMSASSGKIYLWFVGIYSFSLIVTVLLQRISNKKKEVFYEVDL